MTLLAPALALVLVLALVLLVLLELVLMQVLVQALAQASALALALAETPGPLRPLAANPGELLPPQTPGLPLLLLPLAAPLLMTPTAGQLKSPGLPAARPGRTRVRLAQQSLAVPLLPERLQ